MGDTTSNGGQGLNPMLSAVAIITTTYLMGGDFDCPLAQTPNVAYSNPRSSTGETRTEL